MLSLICAFANNRVIGRGNDLPWDVPKDLEHFRDKTKGCPVIMGRRTYESILARRNGKPLPGRPHYVVSTQHLQNLPEGVSAYTNLQSAIDKAKADHADKEVFIIGGAQIYKQSIEVVDRMYLTHIELDVEDGDAFFPDFKKSDWVEISRISHPDDSPPFTFLTYDRK